MSHPEFSRSNEQEPAPSDQLATLHGKIAKVMEEMPEGARIDLAGEGSVFWGQKNGMPIFNAQPETTTEIKGAFVQQYAPEAAARLRIGEADGLDLVFAPACYEAGAPDEEAMPVSAFTAVTIRRKDDPVKADVYVIEMQPETLDQVQSATLTRQMHPTLERIEHEAGSQAAYSYDMTDDPIVQNAVKAELVQADADNTHEIGEQDCAALLQVLEQLDVKYKQ